MGLIALSDELPVLCLLNIRQERVWETPPEAGGQEQERKALVMR